MEQLGRVVVVGDEACEHDADMEDLLARVGPFAPETVEQVHQAQCGVGLGHADFRRPCRASEVGELHGERAAEQAV